MPNGRLFNERGPIARTYADLQSISLIDDIFATVADDGNDLSRSGAIFFAQSAMLFAVSCTDLSIRTASIAEHMRAGQGLAKLCDHACWLEAMMRLGINAARAALTISSIGTLDSYPTESPKSDILENLTVATRGLDDSLFHVFSRYSKVDALFDVQYGNSSPMAQTAHRMKIYFYTLREFHRYIALWAEKLAVGSDFRKVMQESSLQEAYFALQISGDTYFSQFRVLHQVPELLARFCKWRIDWLLTERPVDDLLVVTELVRIGAAVTQMTEQLKPLIYLMMPPHYHEIRANLGQTSGSDSQALARSLFRENLLQLINFVQQQFPHSTAVKAALSVIETQVDVWRELHLNLPRNLLGLGGVRSLIGAKEAVSSAASMRHAFAKRRHPGLAVAEGEEAGLLFKSEAFLLERTSCVTKAKFEPVQSRTGSFAPENRRSDTAAGEAADDKQ